MDTGQGPSARRKGPRPPASLQVSHREDQEVGYLYTSMDPATLYATAYAFTETEASIRWSPEIKSSSRKSSSAGFKRQCTRVNKDWGIDAMLLPEYPAVSKDANKPLTLSNEFRMKPFLLFYLII